MSSSKPLAQQEAPPDVDPRDWEDVLRRRKSIGRRFRSRQPKAVADVVAQVMQKKAYAEVRTAGELADAWRAAVPEPYAKQTTVGGIRNGVLEIVVANSLVAQELGFQKEQLLESVQSKLPEAGIRQIRIKAGPVR